jgi:hypothetical protein
MGAQTRRSQMGKRITAGLGAALAAGSLLFAAAAQAQPRHEEREHREAARFRTPHLVYDSRFHHDHYYPAIGYSVSVLPPGNVAIHFRGGSFWFHSGVWYRHAGPRYVVVRPPIGVIVPVLPPAYTIVYYGGMPYYYANDVYYVQQGAQYAVAAPPPSAEPAAAAPGAPAAQSPGTWYYCQSAQGYYPYVTQCPEGWKSVPAAPPPAPAR